MATKGSSSFTPSSSSFSLSPSSISPTFLMSTIISLGSTSSQFLPSSSSLYRKRRWSVVYPNTTILLLGLLIVLFTPGTLFVPQHVVVSALDIKHTGDIPKGQEIPNRKIVAFFQGDGGMTSCYLLFNHCPTTAIFDSRSGLTWEEVGVTLPKMAPANVATVEKHFVMARQPPPRKRPAPLAAMEPCILQSTIPYYQQTNSSGSCNSLSSCEQKCIESHHGYMCGCEEGYFLNTDGFSCSVAQKSSDQLTFILKKNTTKQSSDWDSPHEEIILSSPDEEDSLAADSEFKHGSQSLDLWPFVHPHDITPSGGKDHGKGDIVIQEGKEIQLKTVKKLKNSHAPENLKMVPNLRPPGVIENVEYFTEIMDVTWMQLCSSFPCVNNGTCVVENNEPRCDCPLGTTGKYCEDEIVVRYPKLDGRGYIAFPVLRDAYKEFHIYLEIKPASPDGLLLFSSERPNARGDFFSVALVNGQVEFRFDCGKGMAVIQSVGRIQIGHWNSIFIQRQLRQGFVRLNSESVVEGKIDGDFSRITLRQELFLGGYVNMSAISSRVGATQKFSGCIQELVINSRKYDMRKDPLLGNAVYGSNVEECSANVCASVECQNGGNCTAKSADTHICLCPLGYIGDNCETKSTLHVPNFNGHSHLRFHGLDRSTLSFTEIEMIIKPTSPDGLIIYNGYTLDRKGDFLMLAMSGGHLEFRFDLGTGPAIIRSPQAVTLGQWHIVKISRTGRDGIMEVDDQPRAEGLSQGAYTQLTLLQNLFIGGHQNFDETSKYANISTSFSGCIQKIVINEKPLKLFSTALNGVNVGNCDHPCQGKPCMNDGVCVPQHDDYTCYCPLGYQGNNCHEESEQITEAHFTGGSYLMYKGTPFVKRTRGNKIDIQMWIKPEGRDGLLFWVGKEQHSAFSDFLSVGFLDSLLQFRYNLGSGDVTISYNATNFFDGGWHFIRMQRDKQDGYLLVDNQYVVEGSSPGVFVSLNTDKKVYIGGMPDIVHHTRRRFKTGFKGCITDVTLGTDMKLDLINEADVGQNVWQCS